MEEIDEKIMKNLTKLTELETNNLTIKSAIFVRKMTETIDNAKKKIELGIDDKIKFYGQKPEKYLKYKKLILNKYSDEFKKIFREYELQYINICEELQEAYANQKMAIASCKKTENLKKEFLVSEEYENIKVKYKEDMKNSFKKVDFENDMNLHKNLKDPIYDYDIKIKAYIKKAQDYEFIIEKCNQKLEECKKNSIEELNNYVSKKTNQLIIYKKNDIISKIINRITNIFKGKQKIQIYVINKSKVELEDLEKEVDNTKNNIRENTINFIEQILKMREKLDNKFNETIKL